MSPPYLASKIKGVNETARSRQKAEHEDGGDILFFRNVGVLSLDYTAVYRRR
jgi:hypothetical protein